MAREPTPPPLDAPYDSITSPHLRSVMFEKLDKDRFVKSYIQSQKPHAIIYAADGKAIQSSWDDQLATTADRQNIQTRVVRDYGFDTPVLQPRVVRLPDAPPDSIEVARDGSENEDEDEAGLAQEVSSKKLTRRTNKKSTGKVKGLSVSSGQKENVALPLNKTQAKLVSKKHPLDADPDSDQDDHVARTCRCQSWLLFNSFVIFQDLPSAVSVNVPNVLLCNRKSFPLAKQATPAKMIQLRIPLCPA